MQRIRITMDDDVIVKIIKEELELAGKKIFTRIKMAKDGIHASGDRSMKLHFRNRVSPIILTGEEIKGEGESTIEVVLIDDSTGNIVETGPEASVRVGIVVLEGQLNSVEGEDGTSEEFNENIVREMEGKKPILAGNVTLKLRRGIGILDNSIKFRHHATKIKPSVFRLGARVLHTIGGVYIKEAKTESFTVKDFRNKYYKKHETPSLFDEVSRLINIRKGGKIDRRLKDNKVSKVEHFLIRLLIDPEGLKRIVNLVEKRWEVTVNNARACSSGNRMYCYVNSEKKMGIVFNILGQILGLYLKNYHATDMLSENQKDAQELLTSAYQHWGNVKTFDDMDSLQQYFTVLISTSMDPCEISGASEMVREMGIYDAEFLWSDVSQRDPLSTFNTESEFWDWSNDEQLRCNVTNDSTAVMFAESEVDKMISKKWGILFYVSRFFTVGKRVALGDNDHNRKKQKIA